MRRCLAYVAALWDPEAAVGGRLVPHGVGDEPPSVAGTPLAELPQQATTADGAGDGAAAGTVAAARYYSDLDELRAGAELGLGLRPRNAEEENAQLLTVANAFLRTPCFRVELALLGWWTGHRRPEGTVLFRPEDPPLGIWTVERRAPSEVCMRWTSGGASGRTYLSVVRPLACSNGGDEAAVTLRFGSAIWPFSEAGASPGSMSVADRVGLRVHRWYSKVLLSQTYLVLCDDEQARRAGAA